MKKHIPNIITSLNLVCGSIGIGMAFKYYSTSNSDYLVYSAYLIFIAAVFDFLDGFAARSLHIKSDFGKELDSLADVVSFGVLPGVILFCLLSMAYEGLDGWKTYIPFVSFLIPVFSALRLAKFNIDTRQADSFIGLPTPANAIFIAAIPLILVDPSGLLPILSSIFSLPGFLIILTFILSFLLVAPFRLFSIKFKNWNWTDNAIQYIFISLSLACLLLLGFSGIPFILAFYILLSLILNSTGKIIKSGEKIE
jgi:CDP-diacylglycerol---serine O-phosphatidyltransferase